MNAILATIASAVEIAAGMVWQTGWSLVLGFAVSAFLGAIVPADRVREALGRGGPREIALATIAGAASSSCSYASASIMRTLFRKGAALVASLAFLFASTNLVLELGIILLLLMGWEFMAAEWIGGLLLIAILSVLVKLTAPDRLIADAREHRDTGPGHDHQVAAVEGATWRERLRHPQARIRAAQNFVMEWRMLWKDLAAGFLIAGGLAAFVPGRFWQTLFLAHSPAPWRALDVLIGPVVAVLSFVCSIGNVPLAAMLWGGGASFGGVVAFLYADLLILPLLDVYRRYFGWRMMAYMATVFFVAIAAAALLVDLGFSAAGITPARSHGLAATVTHFRLDYTFWLNLFALAIAAYLFRLDAAHPMEHGGHD